MQLMTLMLLMITNIFDGYIDFEDMGRSNIHYIQINNMRMTEFFYLQIVTIFRLHNGMADVAIALLHQKGT